MAGFHFNCPNCAARLRLKDRRMIGRTFECPDCRRLLEIRSDGQSGVTAASLQSTAPGARKPDAKNAKSGWAAWAAVFLSPVGIAWIVATGAAMALTAWYLTPQAPYPSQVSHRMPPLPQTQGKEENEFDTIDQSAGQPTVNDRMDALHGIVRSTYPGDHFPAGAVDAPALPSMSRFSWLAWIAAAGFSGRPPIWDRAWNDPLNERFVRQRQAGFLNPLIKEESGQNRYPASHFVGSLGIGADAETLPPDHPRTGAFHPNRPTPLRDIEGGLSNTLLIAGIQQDLGAWAAAGRSTTRAFTREPYVNGPDGFGTGQADGMLVVMADGSVRFFSEDTDPDVIRRLATKAADPSHSDAPLADELHADSQPSDDESSKANRDAEVTVDAPPHGNPFATEDVIKEIAAGEDLAVEPTVAPEVRTGQLISALAQPIVRFQQSEPVSLRELLVLVEELAAADIETSEWPPPAQLKLDQEVTLSLSETTVGEILQQALKRVGLEYSVVDGRISVSAIARSSD